MMLPSNSTELAAEDSVLEGYHGAVQLTGSSHRLSSLMAKPSISLLLPTRGRPNLVKRLFRSIVENSSQVERVEVILYVDEDDKCSHELRSDELRVVPIIGPAMSMGSYNTACLKRACGDILVLANDDMVIGTSGWDDRLIEIDKLFSDKIYLAYGNDLFKKGNMPTFPIISRRTSELLVDPYPAAYRGAFIDIHLFDIFKRLQQEGFDRIRYLDDLIFEHLHYRAGKATCDATYKRRGRFEDDPTFVAMARSRSAAAKRILSALRQEPMPEFEKIECREFVPLNALSAIRYFSRQFLGDHELPLRWRTFLCYWFIGRHLAARGRLWPLVR